MYVIMLSAAKKRILHQQLFSTNLTMFKTILQIFLQNQSRKYSNNNNKKVCIFHLGFDRSSSAYQQGTSILGMGLLRNFVVKLTYTTVQMFVSEFFYYVFYLFILFFFQNGHIQLFKSDSQAFYIITKNLLQMNAVFFIKLIHFKI